MPPSASTGYSTRPTHKPVHHCAAIISASLKHLTVMSLCLVTTISADAQETISLALPINCKPGLTCFFQNYVDHDASTKARDYLCAGRTYDGHDGTDIRIPNLEIQRQGVEVLAAAPGRVVGTRNDMDDVSVKTTGKATIAGKECGNGALIEHRDGWRTQYCHLARESVRVKAGDQTTTGQPIGLVGLSGDTEFVHLHFTVTHLGKTVDPFAYGAAENSCGGGRSIWAGSLGEQMQYRAGEIIDYGFAGIAPTMELIESGKIARHPVTSGSEALVAYVRAIGLEAGDQQFLTVQGPGGASFVGNNLPALDRDKAQFLVIAGKKRTEVAWPAGRYAATYRLMRDGKEMLRKTFEVETRPR